ncbi:adenylate kinase family protein [Candidatus Woesearchaeota archaeon]|nr:adenylate kinase family protein [Candidatus Woesearchaeota archaeon]
MKKAIVVSGCPGTGKTKVAKLISKKRGCEYVGTKNVINEFGLVEGYDKKMKSFIVDTDKLSKVLVGLIKKSTKTLVIDGHLSHYVPRKYVKLCIITKCDIKILKKRLERRGYSKSKVRDNLDAEIFDTCHVEALEFGHKIKVIDTSKGIRPSSLAL